MTTTSEAIKAAAAANGWTDRTMVADLLTFDRDDVRVVVRVTLRGTINRADYREGGIGRRLLGPADKGKRETVLAWLAEPSAAKVAADAAAAECRHDVPVVAGVIDAHTPDGEHIPGAIAGHTLCPGSWRRPRNAAAVADLVADNSAQVREAGAGWRTVTVEDLAAARPVDCASSCGRHVTASDWAVSDPDGGTWHAECWHDRHDHRCEAPDCTTRLPAPAATGRPRRTCSPRCRVALHRHEQRHGRSAVLAPTSAPIVVPTPLGDQMLIPRTEQTWIIVPCGDEKLTHRAPAGELYTGSYHRAARRAAEAIARAQGVPADHVLILSALHGLLRLTDEINPYNLHMRSGDSIHPRSVARQMRELGIAQPGTRVIVLAGRAYADRIRQAVRDLHNPARPDHEPLHPGSLAVDLPLQDTRSMGDQLAMFTAAAATGESNAADLRAWLRGRKA